jgi:hypothetical protein
LEETHDWDGYLCYGEHFLGDLAQFHQHAKASAPSAPTRLSAWAVPEVAQVEMR